jgi:hypothetical protein
LVKSVGRSKVQLPNVSINLKNHVKIKVESKNTVENSQFWKRKSVLPSIKFFRNVRTLQRPLMTLNSHPPSSVSWNEQQFPSIMCDIRISAQAWVTRSTNGKGSCFVPWAWTEEEIRLKTRTTKKEVFMVAWLVGLGCNGCSVQIIIMQPL